MKSKWKLETDTCPTCGYSRRGGYAQGSLDGRFWSHVNKTETCWLWAAQTNNKGYGQIWVNERGKKELAHRVAWFLYTGEWPIQCVLHTCDNPLCVRQSHLFQGTQKDNMEDKATKGRGRGGRANSTKTHCPQGHLYSGDNLVLYQYGKYTYRRCRACQ